MSVSPLAGQPAPKDMLLDSHREPIQLSSPSQLAAVGHRVAHAGQFTESVRITPEISSRIMALADIAPLHNPPSLATLAAAEAELPHVPSQKAKFLRDDPLKLTV